MRPRTQQHARLGRAAIVIFAVAGAVEALQTATTFLGADRFRWYAQDFPAFYTAAWLVANGSASLIYDTAAMAAAELQIAGEPVGGSGVLAYFNPPFFALLMSPLTRLSLHHAYQAWTLLNLALLAIELAMLWRITAPLDRRWRLLLIAGFVTMFPIAYGLQHGQFSILLVTSWTAAFLLLRSGRQALAGAALAPLLIKPELLIPVVAYLLLRRRWAVLAALVPISAIAVLVSVATIGVPAAIEYPRYLLESTSWEDRGVNTAQMFGWNGIVAMFGDASGDPAAYVALGALVLATTIAVASSLRDGAEARPNGFARTWLLLTVATILLDPHFYLQDTILLGPPAVALVSGVRARIRGQAACALFAGWALLALGTFPNQHLHVNAFGLYLAAAAAVLTVRMHARPAGDATRAAVMTPARASGQ